MIVDSRFRPAWWARNAHAQTIYQNLLRPYPRLATVRERLELPDGDFIDLDWSGPEEGPLVLLLHGLEGSIESKYVAGQMRALNRAGLRTVLMHFRGCSGEANRLRRGYHSGVSEDLQTVLECLAEHDHRPDAAVGYSLGGNVLLKWLGEQGRAAPLSTAVAVSVPFRLSLCAHAINRGISRLYNRFLMRRMKNSYRDKFSRRNDAPLPMEALPGLKSFHDFDNAITAPLHGFDNAEHYYGHSSSVHYLHGIRVPTLILHALDDPFMTPEAAPTEQELSPSIRLEISARGGHVGFVAGRWPWRPRWWLEERITGHLVEVLGV
ncbi:hydrolase [Natronospira bacteriovora]|uniref:Hydrolase n=1 Tax=Natronospira bacteriovora TaxID=3069753 RepID=A0ABU0W812_9GAMM|nr:hydrolase [Natronospira sp. AB-CW4]MDQ2069150.1 hydrolase [Natronospira sp. AB-CW4]